MTLLRLGVILAIPLLASCAPQPTKEVPDEFKPGQKYFHKTCSNCHGPDALGKHTQAPSLIDAEYTRQNFSDEELRQTIINGVNKMPPQRNKITDEEIAEIIKYLRHSQQAANLVVEEGDAEEMLEDEAVSDTEKTG